MKKKLAYAYLPDPPYMLVLWWMSFHTILSALSVVIDVPTVKITLTSNAFFSKSSTSLPSDESGR